MTMMFPEGPRQESPKYHPMWEGYGDSKATLQDYREAQVRAEARREKRRARQAEAQKPN